MKGRDSALTVLKRKIVRKAKYQKFISNTGIAHFAVSAYNEKNESDKMRSQINTQKWRKR